MPVLVKPSNKQGLLPKNSTKKAIFPRFRGEFESKRVRTPRRKTRHGASPHGIELGTLIRSDQSIPLVQW